jgi:hypothetical protein
MTVNPADSVIFADLFGTKAMRELFSDRQRLQSMLDVEAALARSQARLGIIPGAAAQAITAAATVDRLTLAEIAASTVVVGYPVVALVKALGAAAGTEAARYVHWGATTQDIVDTALVLQIRAGLDLVEHDVAAIVRALAEKAGRHRGDVMAGRTHLQHALPITFGYKCAVWLAPLLTISSACVSCARACSRRSSAARWERLPRWAGRVAPSRSSWQRSSASPRRRRPGMSAAARSSRPLRSSARSAAISPSWPPMSSC